MIKKETKVFNVNSIKEYAEEYFIELNSTLNLVDLSDLDKIINCFKGIKNTHNTLYSIGNGGSSSISDHLVCDVTKGFFDKNQSIKSFSLVSNTSMITAISNDHDFTQVFKKQLEYYLITNDVVFAISSTGDSENIVKAVQYANERNIQTISLTGFNGGKLKKISKYNLHVNINNYGIVEDIHQSLMHIISQYLKHHKK